MEPQRSLQPVDHPPDLQSRARHVLDVGCGTGNLVSRLRHHTDSVTGLEPDPASGRLAMDRFTDDTQVTILPTDFAGRDRKQRWDAVTMVAVCTTYRSRRPCVSYAGCLTPGGRLVIVGCYRAAGTADVLAALPAIIANPIIGLIKHPFPR